jgi:cyclohexanecarboxylate-CoA ligase
VQSGFSHLDPDPDPDPAASRQVSIDGGVCDLIVRRAALTPSAPMLVDEADRALSFGEYARAVEITAAGLMDAGIRHGSTVSWQLPTSLEAAVLMGALARLGAVQVPIIPVLRHREVSFIVSQTGAQLLVVPRVVRGFDHEALGRQIADEHGIECLVLDEVGSGEFGLRLPAGNPQRLAARDAPGTFDAGEAGEAGAIRWVYYTSGTTADPKGVRHRDRSILNTANTLVTTAQLGPSDVVCAPIPFAHIGGIMFIVVSLRTGCRLVLLEAFDPVTTPHVAARHNASVVGAVPVMMPAFFAAQRAKRADTDEPLLPRLRYLLSGGAPVQPALHDQVRRELGGIGVVSPWGLTEAPQLTFPPLNGTDEQLAGTVGRPAPRVEIRVEGELRIRGPQLFAGYVDSSLDAAAFDADGWFRTGDLGTLDADGFVRVTGRLKDVIIRNGENISVLEIEYTLATHPDVSDAAVIGVPDARTGERCCAFVVLEPTVTQISVTELRAHVEAQGLARHKAPEQVEIIDVIPRNLLGKVQKHELRRILAQRS